MSVRVGITLQSYTVHNGGFKVDAASPLPERVCYSVARTVSRYGCFHRRFKLSMRIQKVLQHSQLEV